MGNHISEFNNILSSSVQVYESFSHLYVFNLSIPTQCETSPHTYSPTQTLKSMTAVDVFQPIFILSCDYRVVESVGKDVTEVTKGDVVIPVILPECGECIDCKSTKSNRCTNFPFKVSPWMPRDGTTRFTGQNGEIIYHFLFISSFSEYTVVDIANLIKIDPEIPPDRACLLGCGVSTGNFLTSFIYYLIIFTIISPFLMIFNQ